MKNISPILLKSVSDQELVQNTKALVAKEREMTIQVLWHLHEIYKRRLFAFYAYPSLFQYAVQELGYSEAAAGRRIAAMRLVWMTGRQVLLKVLKLMDRVDSRTFNLVFAC